MPVGHNTLSKTVHRLCNMAGINGYKTNHSLRVTTATRLFQSGVDEQLIMARTGHRSLDGIRTYKRVSDEQHKQVSAILNNTGESTSNEGTNPIPNKQKLSPTNCDQLPFTLNVSNCQNVTITYSNN